MRTKKQLDLLEDYNLMQIYSYDRVMKAAIPIELILLTLPYKQVKEAVFERHKSFHDKNVSLKIKSGYEINEDTKEVKFIGIPYGVYPRLLLYYICSEAKRTNNPKVKLGDSLKQVLQNIMVNEPGVVGNSRQIDILVQQYVKLFTSEISLTTDLKFLDSNFIDTSQQFLHIAKGLRFWGPKERIDYEIELEQGFFHYILQSKSTIFSTDLLPELKSSPILLDLYIFFNYSANTAHYYRKDVFVSWNDLFDQFGTQSVMKKFKENIKKNLEKLILIHPSLFIHYGKNINSDGIFVLKDSKPIIEPKLGTKTI